MKRLKARTDGSAHPYIFYFALALIIYMPLHVFIVQSASLITGGIELWKAAKDVILFGAVPFLFYIAYRQGLFSNKQFRHLFMLSAAYTLLHLSFLLFDGDDHVKSTIAGSVFNLRLLGFLLLGIVVGHMKNAKIYARYILTAAVLVASFVALFGVAQYFLPPDFLADFGYSKERGVPPLFFIDDKPDLPRVMGTLKDPNSFGAYLILPILATGLALMRSSANTTLFIRPFRRPALAVMLAVQFGALVLTFSRGAAVGLFVSIFALAALALGTRAQLTTYIKKYGVFVAIFIALCSLLFAQFSDTYVFENIVFHADDSTILADPNEKRLAFADEAIEDIVENPVGYGPGTAGLIAISNPQGGVLTENYFLQIAYEVGWFGLLLFVAILGLLGWTLYARTALSPHAVVLLAALFGYAFYSLFVHLWSNEAVALQWWLLSGVILASTGPKKTEFNTTSR